ncbi:MAG: Bro-N domain-containing protein [Candidatus Peribacteraceae bacterium]|nr:Bro-N domain-containing protein [Candidatus Peribacteraceae bacterium]
MTKKESSIVLFHEKQVRRYFDEEKEIWYFSIVDVVAILVDSTVPKRYWSDLKSKLKNEGSEVYEKIVQLKLTASDGKKYATDCFSTQDLFRVIQSIPSPKAEPLKLWLPKTLADIII